MNEAILTTFTSSASSNHENKNNQPQMFRPPENYPLYGTVFNECLRDQLECSTCAGVNGHVLMVRVTGNGGEERYHTPLCVHYKSQQCSSSICLQ